VIPEYDLHAYVDGRLDEPRRAALEQALAARPSDAARVAAYRYLSEQCRAAYAPLLNDPVPNGLALSAPEKPRRWRAARALAAAVVLALGLGVGAAWQLGYFNDGGERAAEMVRVAAMAHAVYTPEVHHPVEARAEANVLAWLSERLGMPVRAPNLESAGFSFMGGRLLPGDKTAAALLMYEAQNGRRLTLYWGPEFKSEHETRVQFATSENGTRVYYWIDEECGYAIASVDLSRDELRHVALMAHEQLEK
jgi:anti-sigma factor RsiW